MAGTQEFSNMMLALSCICFPGVFIFIFWVILKIADYLYWRNIRYFYYDVDRWVERNKK